MAGAAEDRPFDLIAMGRAAVDLYGEQVGGRLEDMATFAKYLGGCAANIAVGSARLGLKVAMLTRVGDEHMGRFVREALAAEGIDVGHVATDPQRLTGLVVLGIRDRSTFPLIFFRENCADMAISPEDFDAEFIASANALLVIGTHFSTREMDATCRTAIALARKAGTKVVFDIDYRPVLWGLTGHGGGEQRFVVSDRVSAHLQSIVPQCDLVVGTEEEIHIAGGTTDTLAALRRLRELTRPLWCSSAGRRLRYFPENSRESLRRDRAADFRPKCSTSWRWRRLHVCGPLLWGCCAARTGRGRALAMLAARWSCRGIAGAPAMPTRRASSFSSAPPLAAAARRPANHSFASRNYGASRCAADLRARLRSSPVLAELADSDNAAPTACGVSKC